MHKMTFNTSTVAQSFNSQHVTWAQHTTPHQTGNRVSGRNCSKTKKSSQRGQADSKCKNKEAIIWKKSVTVSLFKARPQQWEMHPFTITLPSSELLQLWSHLLSPLTNVGKSSKHKWIHTQQPAEQQLDRISHQDHMHRINVNTGHL